MIPLPIDDLLPDVIAAVQECGRLVLVAPPGAGKTTRVPPALLEIVPSGEIAVLEPRRLAARLAARRVADERGESVGGSIGYQVRFDSARSARTRVLFQTEGIFTRRLLADPDLSAIGCAILDEFHERHLHADLALAALQRLRQLARPELKLVVMSATLDPAPIAAFLDNAPVLRAEGRRFPVAIEFQQRPDERPLEQQVASAVRHLLDDGIEGDTLAFLPGAAEIRRAAEACAPFADAADLRLTPLHGDMPLTEQERAVAPAQTRKLILSTNVAESSITVEGVVAVVDSGLARIAEHQPWSGLTALAVRRISQAAAAQRAGRAGRLREGRCLRLYSEADHHARPAQDRPEIQRLDLVELALLCARLFGPQGHAALPWLQPPTEASMQAARQLLTALGAIEPDGALGAEGEALLRYPVHPRLGRLLHEGARRGVYDLACVSAALLGERDIERGRRAFAGAGGPPPLHDLQQLIERFERARPQRADRRALATLGVDAGALHAVDRAARQYTGLRPEHAATPLPDDEREDALAQCALRAFPDRVARRRAGRRELVLAAGGEALLPEGSELAAFDLAVVLDARAQTSGGRGRAVARLVCPIEAEWLLDNFPEQVREVEEVSWNPRRRRVELFSRLRFGQLVLTETRRSPRGRPDAAALLAEQAERAGPGAYCTPERLEQLAGRLRVAAELMPDLALQRLDDQGIAEARRELCESCISLDELAAADLVATLLARLRPEQRRAVDRLCPEQISLPGRRRCPVHYPPDAPPHIASFIQDFFGLDASPSIGGGRLPLQLQLLAPSRRPVQLTQDLPGFWRRHYPTLRKELSRRYPKHAWPEDPTRAQPPPRRR